ncbi:hypothetical protein Hanom_Chr03g00182631 [Helianthus anomalus]
MCLMSKVSCKTTIESGVSLEEASLFLRGRCKVVYILPSLDPTLTLLLVRFSEDEYDDVFISYHAILTCCLLTTQS